MGLVRDIDRSIGTRGKTSERDMRGNLNNFAAFSVLGSNDYSQPIMAITFNT